jgi:hypothetical protein
MNLYRFYKEAVNLVDGATSSIHCSSVAALCGWAVNRFFHNYPGMDGGNRALNKLHLYVLLSSAALGVGLFVHKAYVLFRWRPERSPGLECWRYQFHGPGQTR